MVYEVVCVALWCGVLWFGLSEMRVKVVSAWWCKRQRDVGRFFAGRVAELLCEREMERFDL